MSGGTVAPGSVVAKPPPGRRLTAIREGGLQALPFLAPALILVFFFLIIPVIWTVALSVNRTRGLNFGTEWIGLDNYERLLTRDSRFLDRDEFPWSGALINNIRWLIVYPILCLFLGLVTAVLATRVRYEAAFKAIIFVPMAISATAVGVIWLLVNVIKVFDIVYIMTKIGPVVASRVIAYSYYVETFENGLGGYGAAVAV